MCQLWGTILLASGLMGIIRQRVEFSFRGDPIPIWSITGFPAVFVGVYAIILGGWFAIDPAGFIFNFFRWKP
jgi:hypothetical protein